MYINLFTVIFELLDIMLSLSPRQGICWVFGWKLPTVIKESFCVSNNTLDSLEANKVILPNDKILTVT